MTKLLKSWSTCPYAFGGAAISGEHGGYGFGPTKQTGADLINHAFDRGVRVFDSAPIYGFGNSEKVIGQALKTKRDQVQIISKSGVHWHDNRRVDMSNDPKITRSMLEDSLRRFDSEYIDLYMIHWPDGNVDIRRPLEVLAKAQEEGKIKHLGLCNTNADDLKAAKDVANIEVIQSEFSLFNTGMKDLAKDFSKEQSFMSWGTFDKGILTGRVTKAREQANQSGENECRKSAPWWRQKDVLSKVERMPKLFKKWDEIGLTPMEGALSFNLSHDFCDMVLVGAKSIEDWDKILDGTLKNFSSDELIELTQF
jgi:myo-inositol catabolism protein IolS